MSNGGPKAPKDPTKKRPSIFLLYDKTIEAYGKPDGGSLSPIFLDNGRLANYAKTIGRIEDEALLELLKLQYLTVEQSDVYGDITINLREDRSEEIGDFSEYN
jgi:hypothetical protein